MSNTPSGGVPASAMRQGDLFEDLGLAVDVGFTTARRIELDETSWIEHAPGWLRGSGSLFDELTATAPWEQRHRYMYGRQVAEPRLTAEYEDIAAAPQQLLHAVTAALAQHYGVAYRYLWLNLYRTHRDSTSWHGDPIAKIQETSTVPVLSLGATRRFLIRPAQGGKSMSLAVASGDLIVMGGRAQRDWRHSVPKQATPTGPRISINFAPHLPLSGAACPPFRPSPSGLAPCRAGSQAKDSARSRFHARSAATRERDAQREQHEKAVDAALIDYDQAIAQAGQIRDAARREADAIIAAAERRTVSHHDGQGQRGSHRAFRC